MSPGFGDMGFPRRARGNGGWDTCSLNRSGCPTLATPLFLSLGWALALPSSSKQQNRVHSLSQFLRGRRGGLGPSENLSSADPVENVATRTKQSEKIFLKIKY